MSKHVLNAAQFFHGTGVDFEPGDVVTPRGEGIAGFGSHEYAYAGSTVEGALPFVRSEPHGPAIYEVEPVGEFKTHVHEPSGVAEHGSKEGWRVKQRVPEPEGGWMKKQAETL